MTIEKSMRQPRAPVLGGRGMVVSGNSAASLAGIAILRRGGSLADAMVAASAALAVVSSPATSFGGDCFMLIHDAKTGRTIGLNASGVAPAAATPERFPDGIAPHGPLASVVPGLVRAWDVVHRRYGRLPWKDLFDDAIALAQSCPVSRTVGDRIPDNERQLVADPGCAALYLPNGKPLSAGDMLRQPALARVIEDVARQGADSFYLGDIAQQIGRFFEERGGLIRASDLAAYQPLWVEPLATDYRGFRVEVMPPNSYGVLLLMQLNGLSALDGQTLLADPGRRLGYQMSAMKAAFELGVPSIADPAVLPDAAGRLLGSEVTAAMQAAVRGKAPATRRSGSRRHVLPAACRWRRQCDLRGAERVQCVRQHDARSRHRHLVQQPPTGFHA